MVAAAIVAAKMVLMDMKSPCEKTIGRPTAIPDACFSHNADEGKLNVVRAAICLVHNKGR